MTPDRNFAHNDITSPEIEVLQRIMRNAGVLLDVHDCALALLDATGKPLVTLPDFSTRFYLNERVVSWLVERRAGVVSNDVASDTRFACAENEALCSLLCVPLIEQKQLIGMLVASSPQTNAFNEQHLRLLTFVAEQAALVIGMSRDAEKEAIQSRGKVLSMITHELRSPINTINGYLDLALSGAAGELNKELREFIQRARSGSETLFGLLEDALLVARVDTGQLRLSRRLVSLQDVVIDAVEEMELTAKDREIEISVEIDEDLPALHADAARLQQVLRNLLSNALYCTAAGGHVTITVSTDRVFVGAEEGWEFVTLQVKDTGCGIAPAFHKRIFERFFQVSGNKERGRTGGQGLGLTAVKMIIELHGGTVSVESEPGRGSTFLCVLPVLVS